MSPGGNLKDCWQIEDTATTITLLRFVGLDTKRIRWSVIVFKTNPLEPPVYYRFAIPGTGSTSWSVSTIDPAWPNDTYNFTDATDDTAYASLTTSRYLATLYFNVTAAAAGEYQILLGSSEFDVIDSASGAMTVTPGMARGSNAGIITVNGLSSVPEPGSAVFAGLLLAGVAARRRRRRLSGTPAAKQ